MRYKLEDGIIVDTHKASQKWEEETDWNGSNHIGRSSGSMGRQQALYRSSKGRYYIEYTSSWQGEMPRAELIEFEEAVRWLLLNDCEVPDDLKKYEADVVE